jgi:transposase InsO family protein
MSPNQIWSWDITYLKAPVKGEFYYLYLVLDIYSRLIVGYATHTNESPELAAELIERTAKERGIDKGQLVLHSDNGGPMKGATMLATLQSLGVVPSFSRPRVSDDNPYSEAIFRTLKFRPSFPDGRFSSKDEARAWVDRFVRWYNDEHLHSAIGFVTPRSRDEGLDGEILRQRKAVYLEARAGHPERWANQTRAWEQTGAVFLNPRKDGKFKSNLSKVS